MSEIHGAAPGRFARVRDAFAANFAEGQEIGARFTVVLDGEVVVDLVGGHADRARTRRFDERTLAPIFSAGKAIMALMIARLVDQGRLDYEQPVVEYWPEFGQGGKSTITVGQLMSHQGGLVGLRPPRDPMIWYDRSAVLRAIEEQAPLWEPGTASGYHPVTIGYMADELFRRVDGRRMSAALNEDIARPFGIELWFGLPESEWPRLAEMRKPAAMPDLGEIDDVKRAAFLDQGSSPSGKGDDNWRRMDIPSTHAHGTALGLARLLSLIAEGGRLGGQPILSSLTLAKLTRERIWGRDRVLPFELSWAAGLLRNRGIHIYGPGELAVGHSGWGGSCGFADPETRISAAYVMNKQSPNLIGDPRAVRLIDALYAAL